MPSLEQFKKLEWYKTRPQIIKDLICEFPYAATVLIIPTKQKAIVNSWFENGTLSVIISQEDNKNIICAFNEPYCVFGYSKKDLIFLYENPNIIIDN